MSYINRRALLWQPVPVRFRARTKALLNACSVTPSSADQAQINRMIAGVEDAGIAPYIDRWYGLLYHDSQASRLDFTNPGTDTLALAGGMTSADFIPYQGWKGDGVSKHLTSTYTGGASTQLQANAAFMCLWNMNESQNEATFDAYMGGSGTSLGIRSKSSGSMGVRSNSSSTTDTLSVSSAAGWSAVLRDGASSSYVIRGKANAAKTTASGGRPSTALNILRVTAGATYSTGLVSMIAVGAIPTLSMAATFYDLIATYLVNIGAWDVPIDPDPPPSGANYFTSATKYPDDNSITIGSTKVFRTSRPPTSNSETSATFSNFPITDAGGNLSYSTTWTGQNWWFGWHLRSNDGHNPRANPIAPILRNSAGVECRTEFTTKAKANRAFMVMLLYVLTGDFAACQTAAAVGGVFSSSDVYTRATVAAAPETYFTYNPTLTTNSPYKVSRDTIILPVGTANHIVVDYECQDSRTPLETYTQLHDIITLIHSYGAVGALYSNPLNGPTQAYTGLNSSDYLWQIHAEWDYLFLQMYSKSVEGDVTASWNNQVNLLKGPAGDKVVDYSKIALTFEMGFNPGTSESDAEAGYAVRIANNLPMFFPWPNNAYFGGDGTRRTNRKLCFLSFGRYPA